MTTTRCLLPAVAGALFVACGGGVSVPQGDRLFRGTIAGDSMTGIATVVVGSPLNSNGAAPVAKAKIATHSAVVNLTGTVPAGTTASSVISLSGGGWSATLQIGGAQGKQQF